jgi:hypothetical protein
MRITVSHERTKAEVIQSLDAGFNDLFAKAAQLPVNITVQQRTWQGSTLTFALTARYGLLSTPIKGTVEVTDHDVILDVDLGVFNRFVSEKTARDAISDRIKGLLKS